jgi:hypothetical protein
MFELRYMFLTTFHPQVGDGMERTRYAVEPDVKDSSSF